MWGLCCGLAHRRLLFWKHSMARHLCRRATRRIDPIGHPPEGFLLFLSLLACAQAGFDLRRLFFDHRHPFAVKTHHPIIFHLLCGWQSLLVCLIRFILMPTFLGQGFCCRHGEPEIKKLVKTLGGFFICTLHIEAIDALSSKICITSYREISQDISWSKTQSVSRIPITLDLQLAK